jgi:hypothetical protein
MMPLDVYKLLTIEAKLAMPAQMEAVAVAALAVAGAGAAASGAASSASIALAPREFPSSSIAANAFDILEKTRTGAGLL